MRYTINISFKSSLRLGLIPTKNIVENFKTLKEAEQYKCIIDDTVAKALVRDNVTGEITWWKE